MTSAPGCFRSGFVAIVGVPNVGKSTLLNGILRTHLSIATPRPQTTRDRMVGVHDRPDAQVVFVDTPGLHHGDRRLGAYMEQEIARALADVDVVLLVAEGMAAPGDVPLPEEQRLLARLAGRACVLALNKVDLVRPKQRLLPLLDAWRNVHPFAHLVPIAASAGDGIDDLVGSVAALLPQGPRYFPEDALTDRPERFLVAERIREQIFLLARQEVPYATAVTVERFAERPRRGDVVVEAIVHVERESQRAILVGRGGAMIREIGTRARHAATRLLGRPVHVKLRVRVDPDWRDDAASLRKLGYGGP